MVDDVSYDAEWAYWIDIKTFKMKRLQKKIPVGSIVLTKVRGTTDEGKKFVQTDYGLAERDGVRDIPKKEASKILTRLALDYMKEKKRWPAMMTIEDSFKEGDIEIVFTPSEYDSFILKFTKELVGANPIEFLRKLKPSVKDQEQPWKVETAKSGRSKCRTCGEVIEEGRFRIGEPYLFEEHLSYRWHHPKCIAPMLYIPVEKLDGFQLLQADEKIRLRKLLQK